MVMLAKIRRMHFRDGLPLRAYSHAFDLGSPYGLTISGKKADRYPQEADNPVWYQACF